ncbi:MAG: methyltransferase domain-containing protein [Nitrospirae bacterium]|nr:methyltransferase domain-containing protein [Nitrospirota bacterium]
MSKIQSIILPKLGTIQLVIKTKRESRAHSTGNHSNDESLEWFYWNKVWFSEVALAEWFIKNWHPDGLKGKHVLELGCGTGLAGLACAKLGASVTFSDKVPVAMESVEENCHINGITGGQTLIVDWADPVGLSQIYDFIIGSEIFYDITFLPDICRLLERGLPKTGSGIFCDPNRLGLDKLEANFSKNFTLTLSSLRVQWPQGTPEKSEDKEVCLYEFQRNNLETAVGSPSNFFQIQIP